MQTFLGEDDHCSQCEANRQASLYNEKMLHSLFCWKDDDRQNDNYAEHDITDCLFWSVYHTLALAVNISLILCTFKEIHLNKSLVKNNKVNKFNSIQSFYCLITGSQHGP